MDQLPGSRLNYRGDRVGESPWLVINTDGEGGIKTYFAGASSSANLGQSVPELLQSNTNHIR